MADQYEAVNAELRKLFYLTQHQSEQESIYYAVPHVRFQALCDAILLLDEDRQKKTRVVEAAKEHIESVRATLGGREVPERGSIGRLNDALKELDGNE